MDAVLHLYEDLIIPRFRSERAPMPIVVLRAEESHDSRSLPLSSAAPETLVTEVVEVLHRVYREGRVLYWDDKAMKVTAKPPKTA